MTTPLPTPPNSVTRPTTFDADCDAFLAALTLFQTELNALQASLSPIGRNVLINGSFDLNQRAPATNADDTYAHDRWNILTQTNTVAVTTLGPAIETGYNSAMRITQSQASSQRFGFLQIVEQSNCVHLRGGSATLSGRIRCSQTTTIRYAIIGWTGTADAVTSDIVNSWTNTNYTAGNFFTLTSTSVLATGSQAVTANIWTNLAALTATVGTSFNNLIVFVWTDSAQAQNVTLDCDYMQFEAGASSTPLEKRSYAQELLLCQRYCKAITFLASSIVTAGQCRSTSDADAAFSFGTTMRSAPTITPPAAGSSSGQVVFQPASGGTPGTVGSHNWNAITKDSCRIAASGYTSVFTAGNATALVTNSGGPATVLLEAEL